MVGCVIGVERDGRVETLGMGHHRRFGGPHAEIEAMESARRRGASVRRATAWVTLEPCAHEGKTPACALALAEAGLKRVVFGARDPGGDSGGGAALLESRGVEVSHCAASEESRELMRPFEKRIRTSLPWVIGKWGQTLDGRIATRSGDSKWITNERSRALVHRLRARVDVVLTGVGTVLADDPLLTARGVRRMRRRAARVVIDPALHMSTASALARSAGEARVIVVCAAEAAGEREEALRRAGVEVWRLGGQGEVDLGAALRRLASELDATNVLVEAGGGLMGRLLDQRLVDEVWAFVAPVVLGDGEAVPLARGAVVERLGEAQRLALKRVKRVGDDTLLVYRRQGAVFSQA